MNGRLEQSGGDDVRGLFLNTVMFRQRLGSETWSELVRQTFAVERKLLPYRRFPFAVLEREWGEHAPVDVAFHYTHFHVVRELMQSGNLAVLEFASTAATNFKLLVTFGRNPITSRLRFSLQYDAHSLSRAQILTAAGLLERVLRTMAADPESRHQDLSLLTPEERHQLLREWSGLGVDHARQGCLTRLFEAQVRLRPDAVAATFQDHQLTYAALNARANRLARHLRDRGSRPGAPVGILVERSLGMLVAVLGILKAGGAYLPLDPSLPRDRLAFMVADALGEVPLLVTQEDLAGSSGEGTARLPARLVRLDADRGVLGTESADDLEDEPQPEQPAYVIYTSGSTGRPKGVVVTHRNVMQLLAATEERFGFSPADTWTLFHSYAFDFSVWEMWGALLYGGRLVVVPFWVSRSPEAFRDLLERHAVTVLNQTPSAFRQLIEATGEVDGPALAALRAVIFGGEALEPRSLGPWLARFGDGTERGPALVNMYGITETTVHVTYRRLGAGDVETEPGSVIGRPLPHLAVHLLDAWQRPVPVGVAGELYVGGEGVAWGYLGRPELTAERFVPDPFSGVVGGRLYRSGDLGRWRPSGELEYLGRSDEQVKVRGFRIEPGEIASVLEQHPSVSSAVVLAVSAAGGERRLVAYVVPVAEAPRPEALRSYLGEKLPDYMVPAEWVLLSAIPLTSNGKLDRHKLHSMKGERVGEELPYVAPSSELEITIAMIWQEVLGCGSISVHRNFFDIGGHSLNLIRVQRRLGEELGRKIPLLDLFRAPTIASLAEKLAGRSEGQGATEAGEERAHRRQELRGRRHGRGRGR
jgi:amino acid adenylation domain-containing protein